MAMMVSSALKQIHDKFHQAYLSKNLHHILLTTTDLQNFLVEQLDNDSAFNPLHTAYFKNYLYNIISTLSARCDKLGVFEMASSQVALKKRLVSIYGHLARTQDFLTTNQRFVAVVGVFVCVCLG